MVVIKKARTGYFIFMAEKRTEINSKAVDSENKDANGEPASKLSVSGEDGKSHSSCINNTMATTRFTFNTHTIR